MEVQLANQALRKAATDTVLRGIIKAEKERRDEFSTLFTEVIKASLNVGTRRWIKTILLVLIDTPSKNREEITTAVRKLQQSPLSEDAEWLEKFIPQHYR